MVAIRTFSLTDAQVYQEYQIGSISSASAAQLLAFQQKNGIGRSIGQAQVVLLEARGDDVVFKFGDSTVSASKTVTSNALPLGNFSVPKGIIVAVTINGTSQNYVSCITENTGGTGIIRLTTTIL